MSQQGSMGGAQLTTELITKSFEKSLEALKKKTFADFKAMGVASDNILGKDLFKGATSGAQTFSGTLKPIHAQIKEIVAEAEKLGGAFAKGGSGVPRLVKEVSPLRDSIRGLSNSLSDYKLQLVSNDGAQDKLAVGITNVVKQARTLRDSVAQNSTEYGRLTGIIKSGTTSLNTAERGMRGLGAGVLTLGNALPAVIGVAGLGGLSRVSGDLATKANAVNVSYDILGLTMDRLGVSSSTVQDSVKNVASTFGVAESQLIDYSTQLLRIGVSADQIDDTLIAGASSALAFGKSATAGFEGVTNALVTQNSTLLQGIGVSQNIGAAMGKAAEGASQYGKAASDAAAAQAGLEIILDATADEVASVDKLTGGLAGSQAAAAKSSYELQQRVGNLLIPFETLKNKALAGLLDSFAQMPQATQASVAGIGGVTVGVSALATGITALRPLLAATFAPPGGALVVGVVAASALGVALFNIVKNMDPLADGLNTLTTSQDSLNESANTYVSQAQNVVAALTSITDATTEKGLVGAIDTYISTLNEDGATAMKNFVANTLTGVLAQGDLQKAAKLTTEKILELETTSAQGSVEANKRIIAANQEMIGRLQRDMATLEQDAANARDSGMSRFAQANLDKAAELASAINQLSEENIRATRENEAYAGSLKRLQTIQSEVANGTLTADEALDQLIGNYEDVSGALGKVFGQAEPLPTALNNVGTGGKTAAEGLSATATEAERALAATKDYAFMLSQGVQQGVRPFEGALHLLTTALERQESQMQTLAKNGKFGANYELARQKAELLRQTIEELTGLKLPEPDVNAAYTAPLSEAGSALEKFSGFFGGIVSKATTTFQGIGNAASTAFTNTAKPLGDLSAKLQEIDRNAKLFGDTEDLAAQRAAAYRTAIEQLAAVHGENSGIVQQLKTLYDEYTASVQANEDATTAQAAAVERQTQFLDDLKAGLADVGTNFRDTLNPLGDLNAGLAEIDRNAELTGDSSSVLADKTRLYESALTALGARLGQTHPLVLLLKKRFDESKDATDADTKAKERAAERTRVLEGAISSLSGVLKGMVGNLVDADSEMGIFANTAVDALSSLLTLDFVGFFSAIAQGISDMFTAAAEESKRIEEAVSKYDPKELEARGILTFSVKGLELDEGALAEYEQYLEAIETYGQGIADKFYTVGENGKYAFDEEAAAAFADGLERVKDRADGIADAMKAAKDATDSVLEAEISARQDTLDAKLASQDGGYSEADIFEQQAISIGEAAKKRDEAYQEAADLEAAGQAELAARRRAAAEEAYAAEVSQINSEAEGRAEAIGKNSADFRSRLDQAAQTEGQKWTDYWNQDAAAQIEAQKQAQIQLRRFQQVLNSERYQELLAAGVSEEVAWQTAANELGYTINQTTGDLVTAQEQAGQQISQSLANSSTLVTGAAQGMFGGAATAVRLGSTQLGTSLGAASTTAAMQGGALASTISSVYDSITSSATDGSNLFGAALTNGANLNIGAIADVGNALGGQIVTSGNATKDAQLAAVNANIKQAADGAKKQAENETRFGNELNRVIASVAFSRNKQFAAAFSSQGTVIAGGYNHLIEVTKKGYSALFQAANGKFTTISAGGFSPEQASKAIATAYKAIGGNFNADFAEVIDPAKYQEQQAKKVKATEQAKADKVNAPKGSLNYIDKQIQDLQDQYDRETDKGKRAELAKKIKALKDQRKKIDVLGEEGKSGSKDSSSGSGKGAGKDIGPKGSPSYIQEEIRKLDEQINKSNNEGKIRDLQKKKEVLQAQLDKLLGRDGPAKAGEPAKGSVDYIQKQLQEAQAAYDSATTDKARAAAAERIKVLKAELKEKQKLLEDAAKDAQDAVKGTVISIESPLADLGTLQYLAESVSKSVSSLPTSISAASTGAAASVTRIPETYTSTVLPSYQAQMDVATTMFDKSVSRFDNATIRFDRSSIRIEQALKRMFGAGGVSPLVSEARGDSITSYQFK